MKSFDYPLLQLNEFEQVKVCLSEHKSCQVTGCGESQLAHLIVIVDNQNFSFTTPGLHYFDRF